jgi:hypothetical protein
MDTRAFSGHRLRPVCVDCRGNATHLITYLKYQIGDVVCNMHRIVRSNALGRRINTVQPLAYVGKIKLLAV